MIKIMINDTLPLLYSVQFCHVLQDIGRYIYVLVAQPGEWNLLETFSSVKRAQLTYNANANKRTR